MLAALSLMGLVAAQEFPAAVALPASFKSEALAGCAPATIEAAEACLRASMSAEDLAVLNDRVAARRFRSPLDCALIAAWKLDDSTSPMGRTMDRLIGVHRPLIAAGMIISDLQVRANSDDGHGLPFGELRSMFAATPPPPNDLSVCDSPKS
ncbi:MAG: hypothetical protein V4574_07110 [Pseudomonadota bacterium]